MKFIKSSLLFSWIIAPILLTAHSITLNNDTEYDLTAIIRGRKGVLIEEVSVPAFKIKNWIYNPKILPDLQGQSITDLTPFTVSWMCLGGKVFAVCPNIVPGMQISPKDCDGSHYCEPKKDPPGY